MNYNYTKLLSLFNLQQKEIKDVLVEAQKALETLDINRNMVEQHLQLTLRLQEITTSLDLLRSRAEEVKKTQRSLELHLQNGNQLHLDHLVNNNLDKNNQLFDKTETPASNQADTFTTSSNNPPITNLLQPNHQTKFSEQLQFMQLEVIELNNRQLNLEAQRNHFETELTALENQLTARGIGSTQQ